MATLTRDHKGNFKSRKRLPDDIRDEYGRLYGARYEAKFFAPASTSRHEATKLFGEWLAEIAVRIETIRAARDGTGASLTAQQARKLAGEWYDWFLADRTWATHLTIEYWRDKIQEAIKSSGLSEFDVEHFDDLWRERSEFRGIVRPVIADIADTAQFLAAKRIVLTIEAKDRFLDFLYDDLSAALKRLERLAEGNYSPDAYRDRFARTALGTDTGMTPWELFQTWVAERKPERGTIESWRYPFQALADQFKGRSAASIMPEEADVWIKDLITRERSARTVKQTWWKAANTVFRWAVEHKHITRNPFAEVKVTVPKKRSLRETKAFRPQEARIILRAASAITDLRTPTEAAKRWVPWLCAYTGARPGEITQLRGQDVIEQDGVQAIRITPEAGTVKGGAARIVPIHQHVLAQGFLKFIERHGRGPLFYKQGTSAGAEDPIKQKKPRAAQARQRLAAWVRGLGVDDPNISPNHAWRHTFKQIADRAGISERMSDYITGHAHKSVGAGYGAPTLDDMTSALKKFPRYAV
jgi:integrase